MKSMLLAAVSILTLSAGAAYAEGEAHGNPFEFRTQGVITTVAADRKKLPAKSQDPFPFRADERVVRFSEPEATLPPVGAEGGVQTANSLPVGFSSGTQQYEQHRRVLAFWQREDARRAAVQMAQMPQKTAEAARHG